MGETGRPTQMMTAIFRAVPGRAAYFERNARRGIAEANTPKPPLTWRLGVLSAAV